MKNINIYMSKLVTLFRKIHFRSIAFSLIVVFSISSFKPTYLMAQNVLSAKLATPPIIIGLKVHPAEPLKLDFIIDRGDGTMEDNTFQTESNKLINYFMATLTVPENEMWVNLSPTEKNRIIADGLSQTEMGRDMLEQDFQLKQLAASLLFSETEKQFSLHPLDKKELDSLMSRVWIIPDKADVFVRDNNIFVVNSHLKIMFENLSQSESNEKYSMLLKQMEEAINNSDQFANVRQIYNSMILATWYKKNLKESLLGKVYLDQNKVSGIDLEDKNVKEKIYAKYLEAFTHGVQKVVKEEYDPQTQQIIAHKYFSGGLDGVKADLLREQNNADVWFRDHGQRSIAIVSMNVEIKSDRSLGNVNSTFDRFVKGAAAGLVLLFDQTLNATTPVSDLNRNPSAIERSLDQDAVEQKILETFDKIKRGELVPANALKPLGKPAVPILLKTIKDTNQRGNIRIFSIASLGELVSAAEKDLPLVNEIIKTIEESGLTKVSNPTYKELVDGVLNAYKDIAAEAGQPIPAEIQSLLTKLTDTKISADNLWKTIIELSQKSKSFTNRPVLQKKIYKALGQAVGALQAKIDKKDSKKEFLDAISYRNDDVLVGTINIADLYSIYTHSAFKEVAYGTGMDNLYRLSLARMIDFTLKRFGFESKSLNGDLIRFIAGVLKEQQNIDILNQNKKIYVAMNDDGESFNPDELKKFLKEKFQLKSESVEIFVGEKDKDRFREAVRTAPKNSVFWYLGHGGGNHFWFNGGQIGVESSDNLEDPRGYSYQEKISDLQERAKKIGGLGDMIEVCDQCYGPDWNNQVLNQTLNVENEVGSAPLVVYSANLGETAKMVGFDEKSGRKTVFLLAIEAIAKGSSLKVADIIRAQQFGKMKEYQHVAFMLPVNSNQMKKLLEIVIKINPALKAKFPDPVQIGLKKSTLPGATVPGVFGQADKLSSNKEGANDVVAMADNVGGIDFNAEKLLLNESGDKVLFVSDSMEMQNYDAVISVKPVITNISPVKTLGVYLDGLLSL